MRSGQTEAAITVKRSASAAKKKKGEGREPGGKIQTGSVSLEKGRRGTGHGGKDSLRNECSTW